MRSLIITIVGTILAGLLLYYFTSEKPELIYTLTDPITLLPEEKDSKIGIQQLEVKNVGDSEAKKIRALIGFPVISYEMVKYSKADDVEVFHSEDSLEINYPGLPPEASFKLTIKSGGISKAFLSISHLGGIAKDATEIRQWKVSDFLSWSLVAFYLFWIRTGLLETWESKPSYEYENILKGRKPFYMNSVKWNSLRKKSMDYMIERDERTSYYSDGLQDPVCLKLLSNQKPEYFSDEEWDYISKKATKSFEKTISSNATSAYYSEHLLKLLKIDKPLHFPQDKWLELKEKLNKSFISLRGTEFSRITYSTDEILSEINTAKPKGLSDKHWSEYIETCKTHLFSTISSDIELKGDPIKYLQSCDIGVLNEEYRKKLHNRAYLLALQTFGNLNRIEDAKKFIDLKRADWIKDDDYDKLYSKSKKTLELDSDIEKHAILLGIMKDLMACRPLPKKKPNLISDDDWETFIQMDNEIRVQKQKNEELKSSIKEKEDKAKKLMNTVEKQLEIIHVFLNDPTVLDRIEHYSDVFAPGNLENLKKLAELMTEQIKNRNKDVDHNLT